MVVITIMCKTYVHTYVEQFTKVAHTYLSEIELRKRLTNHAKEYWYMGSMLGRSVVEKNNTEP